MIQIALRQRDYPVLGAIVWALLPTLILLGQQDANQEPADTPEDLGVRRLIAGSQEIGSYDPEKLYEEYFADRYGKKAQRPGHDVIESRCIEDMRLYANLVTTGQMPHRHFGRIVQLWDGAATSQSLPALERVMNACWWLSIRSGHRAGVRFVPPGEQGAAASPSAIWMHVTKTWLRLKKQAANTPDQWRTVLVEAMTLHGAYKPVPLLLDESILAAGKPIRTSFYETVFSKELRPDAPLQVMRGRPFEPVGQRQDFLAPTDEELNQMLASNDQVVSGYAKTYAATTRPRHKAARAAVLDDVQSKELARIANATGNILAYIAYSDLPADQKKELFVQLDKRLRELEQLHTQKRTHQLEVQVGDPFSHLLPTRYVPELLSNYLFLATPLWDNPEIVNRHSEAFQHHLNWFEKFLRSLPENEREASGYETTIKRWRVLHERN